MKIVDVCGVLSADRDVPLVQAQLLSEPSIAALLNLNTHTHTLSCMRLERNPFLLLFNLIAVTSTYTINAVHAHTSDVCSICFERQCPSVQNRLPYLGTAFSLMNWLLCCDLSGSMRVLVRPVVGLSQCVQREYSWAGVCSQNCP